MTTRSRKFQRPLGERRYKTMFILAVEGEKTEPRYFDIFNDEKTTLRVYCLEGKHESSPPQVMQRMIRYLKEKERSLKTADEAWLVVDKDQWTDEQLSSLHRWASQGKIQGPKRGFALSNPSFEYWILLHFEDGKSIDSSRQCTQQLKKYLPEYDKSIEPRAFTEKMIREAVERARRRDTPPCVDWPRNPGYTTVYRLVERIFRIGENA